MDQTLTKMKLALAAVAVVLTAVVVAVVLVERGRGTTTYTPIDFSTVNRAYPMDTLADVRAHTDAVVLATILAERESREGRGGIYEGEPLIGRQVTVRIDRTLWQKQGAPVPPDTFEIGGGVWSQSNGVRSEPLWSWGDVGKQYLYVLVQNPDGSGNRWAHEFELLTPIMNGRTPTMINSSRPWFAEIQGKTPDELEQLFAATLGG
jgi:hypothetical protein